MFIISFFSLLWLGLFNFQLCSTWHKIYCKWREDDKKKKNDNNINDCFECLRILLKPFKLSMPIKSMNWSMKFIAWTINTMAAKEMMSKMSTRWLAIAAASWMSIAMKCSWLQQRSWTGAMQNCRVSHCVCCWRCCCCRRWPQID